VAIRLFENRQKVETNRAVAQCSTFFEISRNIEPTRRLSIEFSMVYTFRSGAERGRNAPGTLVTLKSIYVQRAQSVTRVFFGPAFHSWELRHARNVLGANSDARRLESSAVVRSFPIYSHLSANDHAASSNSHSFKMNYWRSIMTNKLNLAEH
jgi:hypothetical protein